MDASIRVLSPSMRIHPRIVVGPQINLQLTCLFYLIKIVFMNHNMQTTTTTILDSSQPAHEEDRDEAHFDGRGEALDAQQKVDSQTYAQLGNLRGRLINIGNAHNPLVNFRPSKYRGLQVQGIDPDHVFDHLVNQNKTLRFSPRREIESDHDPDEGPKRLRAFQTDLENDQLRTLLRRVANDARSEVLEKGFSSLHLALGFLKTYARDDSEIEHSAPLILIPVDLNPLRPQGTHSLHHNEADIGANIALHEKLRAEFGITLPNLDENVIPSTFFEDVEMAIARHDRWEVDDHGMYLGFFSFGTFMMYRDLIDENWPSNRKPHANESLRRIFVTGYRAEDELRLDPDLTSDDSTDDDAHREWPLGLEPVVLDADSSQMKAIESVRKGGDLVIQGPPGTGKSQTITNIIADCVSRGLTVLFVAEKLAALEVVKRRLDEANCGHLALELHSYRSNKKAVIESLQIDSPERGMGEQVDQKVYQRLASELDAHANAVRELILESGMTYQEIRADLEEWSAKRVSGAGVVNVPGIQYMMTEELNEELNELKQLCEQHDRVARVDSDRFSDVRQIDLDPTKFHEAIASFQEAAELCENVGTKSTDIAGQVNLQAPRTFSEVQLALDVAERAANGPPIDNVTIGDFRWEECRDAIVEVLSAGPEMIRLRSAMSTVIPDGSWNSDFSDSISVWMDKRNNPISRWFSRDFRSAHRELAVGFGERLMKDRALASQTFDQINAHRNLKQRFASAADRIDGMFGCKWIGEESNFDELRSQVQWVWELRRDVNQNLMPEAVLNWQKTGSMLEFTVDQVGQVRESILTLKRLVSDANDIFKTDMVKTKQPLDDEPITSLTNRLRELGNLQFDALQRMQTLRNLQTRFNSSRLQAFTRTVERLGNRFREIEPEVRCRWLEGLRDHAHFQHPNIANFDPTAYEQRRLWFAELDAALPNVARKNTNMVHQAFKPGFVPFGESDILRNELRKKTKHRPIRELIQKAGNAIQLRKPVFMMSPMSVAKFLAPDSVNFDVVVFDEASQVRPEHAIGAVLRGKQVVVVGDDKQLPPTNFFLKIADPDAEEDDATEESATKGLESILDLMNAKGASSEQLRWHYRSRNEELIAFSNRKFYDHELITCPGSGSDLVATGLELKHLPDCLYIGGGTSVNPGEARAVAREVMKHAAESSELSLGVVAFSAKQRDQILDELETLRKVNPDHEDFFADNGAEPFFVKNLENVQGDERDVILISVGYGFTEDDKLPQRFGPINQNGGERRLNVLVTRAKLAMKVFSNFKAGDLTTSDNSPLGVKALKEFLAYAAGEMEPPKESEHGPESRFEERVASVVRELGYEVETQLGQSGYRIDIAVRSRTNPGSYMLAIECDGASYHSHVSARDRDRIRQQVLEDRGWRIHRIWSTDWFSSNPEDRKAKLKDAIEDAERLETKRQDS